MRKIVVTCASCLVIAEELLFYLATFITALLRVSKPARMDSVADAEVTASCCRQNPIVMIADRLEHGIKPLS